MELINNNIANKESLIYRLLKALTFIILLSADIDISIGIPNFGFALVLILLPLISTYKITSIHYKLNISKAEFMIIASSFIISMFILLYAKNPSNIVHAIKLLLIFTLVYPLIKTNFDSEDMIRFSKFYIIINFFLIILGYIGFVNMAKLTGLNRGSTILNYAGSLYKTSILIIPYLMWDIIKGKGNIFNNISLILVSIFIVLYDGSRTGLLLVILYIPIFIIAAIRNYYQNHLYNRIIFIVFTLVIINIIASPFYIKIFKDFNALSRLSEMITILKTQSLREAFYEIDMIRGQMILDGINTIKKNNLFLGSGFSSTTTHGVVIHNTYLQIIADLGIIAFFGFIVIMIVPLFIKIKNDYSKYIFPSKVVIFSFSIMALFHPLSVQASDWAIYLIPLLIINEEREYYKRRCRNVDNDIYSNI